MTNIRRRFPILLASALALLAILGALLLPITAQAQTATVLVSSVGQPVNGKSGVNQDNSLGQAFSIAAGSGNYTLTSIEISLTNGIAAADIGSLSVSVWSTDSSGLPSASLHTLANPASITADTTATFNAQSGATLEAGNTYAVLVSYDKNPTLIPQWSYTESGAFDADPATGWSLSNSALWKGAGNWNSFTDEIFLIRINGSAVGGETPTLSTDATLSGLSLGTGVTLSPAFASGTDTYTASVANSVDEVTVTPTTNHASATVEILDTDDNELNDSDDVEDDFQVALSVGDTVIKVKVTAEDGTSTQTYTVTVTRAADMTPDDPPDDSGNVSEGDTDLPGDTTTTGKVEVGGSVTGKIRNLNDKDWFAVELEAGKRYQIDMEGADTGRGTLTHPRVSGIYDAAANAIANTANNGGGVGNNARVIYTPDAAGTYYVEAYFQTGELNRTYTLSVILLGANGASEADTDFPATTATTGRVEVGSKVEASVTGNIESATDEDWFRVDLEAGKTYQIDMKGEYGGGGTLEDPYLNNIRDSSSNEIEGTFNDDIDPDNNLNSQITFTPTAGGTYYLLVGAASSTTGTYTLSVREIPPPCTLNIGDLWCGVVTVGEYKSGGITFAYGFVDATTDTGALSDTTFDVSPNSYTIDRASVGVSGLAGQLIFSLTSALTEPDRAKLVLHVDGSSGSFAFDGVTPTASFGYRWAMSGLDWSSETSVTLRLRDTPVPSTDATLSGLSLGTGVTLSPAFASGTVTYTASVANSVDEVTVTPTTNHASATVVFLDTDDNELDDEDDVDDDFQVALSVGDTVIKVKVTAEDGTSTQTYTVTVTRAADMTPDDPPDDSGNVSEGDTDLPADTTTTGKVEVGGSVTGTIADTTDDLTTGDSFKVDLEAGKRYQIDVEGAPTGRGTLPDPWLGNILDPDGNLVQDSGDNDGGVGLNARLILKPTADGTHYVKVNSYFVPNTQPGTYTLSVIVLGANGVSEADTDFPNNNTTSGRVEVGASVTGNTATVSGDDWFRVDLEAGKTYQFDLEGAPTNRGTLPDPLLKFYDGSENQISRNDDIDPDNNLNSQIVYAATATGTYYLSANSTNLDTGTYTLSVRDITPATCTLNTGDVWCGVVTVGMFTLDGTSYLGYLDGTGGGGMLSDNDFDFTDTELDSKSHTITGVLLASGTLSLIFEDSQDEDDKPVLNTWDLQVGTDTFALDDDDVTQLPTGGYQWTGTGLSWSVGDTVTLRLRGETGPPSVANVAVTSVPLLTSSGGSEQDTYGAGDEIEFTVTFSQVVVVTGDPQFGFSLSGARQADYRSGSGSTALKFVYTVQSSDSDDDGIWIGNHNSNTKSLQLDANDEITSPGGIDANLEHDQKQVQAGHKVDGSRSSKPTLSVADAAATEGSNVSFTVTLSAADAADVTATWTASIETGDTAVAADLGATKTGTVTVSMGNTTGTFTVSTVEDSTVEVNETFTVTLSGVSSNAQLSSTAATAQGTINNDDLATLSTDATLSGLSLGTGVTLSPAFASGTATYTASVANSVDKVTVTPTTNHASATVEILDTDDLALTDADSTEDGFQVALSVGSTQFGVLVTAEDGTTTKFYTVNVTRDDFPNDTTTTGQVEVGGSVTGTGGTLDRDWFKVVLEAGTRYQIDLEGADTGRGTVENPAASMFDAGGTHLPQQDDSDSGVGNNARIIYTPTATGTYHVQTWNISAVKEGTYTLSVIVLGANGASEADTDFPLAPQTAGRVEVGASATGNIGDSGDRDWFKVVLEAGKTYQIDMKGVDGGGGTLEDPYLHNIRDSESEEIFDTGNDDIGGEDDIFDSQITFMPTAAGAYYLVAAGAADTGTYTLSVREVEPPCTLNTGDLWCGVVTVAEIKTTDDALVGHGFVEAGGLSAGSLAGNPDETMFSVGDNDYTIQGAYIQVPTGATLTGTLYVLLSANLTDDDKAGLLLPVDDTTTPFEFSGATKGTTGLYSWGASGLSWSAEDTVTIRVRPRTLSVADASDAENNGEVEFTVTLSEAAATAVTATWTASIETGDTAVAADLGSTTTGTVTVAIGDTMGTFEVPVVNDATDEGDETFTVTLSSPSSNAKLSSTAATAQGTINNDDLATPAAPTGLSATAGNRSVALAWNAPASDADITRHEYRYKTDGSYPDTWKKIPYSATGEFNADGFTVTKLDNDTAHTFQLHAVNDDGVSAAVESSAVTPSGSGDVIVSITMRRYDGQDGEPYGVGDEIVFVVEFSRNVANSTNPGNEKVRFDIGSTRKNAGYYSGGVGKKLWYKYTIGEGDVDSDGIEIPAGPTALPETYFYSSDNDDEFDESGIRAQGPFPDRKVDGVYPTLDSAAVNGTELVLTWDETLRDDSGPAAGDFAVTVAGSSRSVSGVAVAGSAVRLTLASAVTAGQTVTVSYTKGTNPLKDLASNDAPGLTDQAVTNNTAPPDEPTLSIADAAATEGSNVTFAVTLSAAAAADVTATWTASIETGDTAVAADLGTTRTGTVTVSMGNTTGTFTVSTVEDSTVEVNETFTVTLSSVSSNAQLETDPTAKGTIEDDDATALSTDATLSGLSLGTGVTLSPAFASGTVTYTASVANSVDKVTVTPTTNHASATVEILDKDDNELNDADDVEDDFQVALSVGDTVIKVKVTAEDGTSTQTYTVTVTRDDFPADTTTTGKVDVGGSVTGNITSASDRDWFRVDLKKDKRYQIDLEGAGTNRGTLTDPTLNAMRDASSNSISGTGNSDSGVGINARTIFTALADGAHYVVAAGNGATGTYTLSVIVLGANGASEADFDFPATTATSGRVEVGASATGNIKNLDDAYDWFRVDLEAGKTYQYDLEGVDTSRGMLDDPYLGLFDGSGTSLFDDDDDGTGLNSRITHTPATGGTYYLGAARAGTSAGTYTLSVRDITLPTLSIADAAATEGSPVSFTVTLSAAAAADVTATWTASIETVDTAVAADLGTTTTGTVTVAIGDTMGTFTVATVEDTTVEVNETFTVTLSSPSSNAQLSSTAATAQGTINNDDLATVSVGDAEGDEDDGVEFTLTLSAAAPADVTVDWTASIESGDSASTADLATTKTGTVTITKGATTKKFTVPVNDDTTDEPDQTFTVTLSNPTPPALVELAADPTATGTIEDDDDPPTLTVADARHVEGHSESRTIVTVSLSEVSEKRVRFKLRPVDRTGDTASGTDWSALYSSPPFHAIDAGIMSRSRFAGVVIQNDTLDEDDETLTVEAYSLENATGSAADREATITIVDDDPTPTVTVADAAATEGDKVEFVVTLSAVSGRDVDVDYATSVATGDGAVSGTDFTAASGTLTIAAADSTATGTIEVQTTEDDASESAETFTLTISSPDNATLTTDTTATGTINNRATTAAEPTTFAAAVGDEEVVLSWDAPVSASGVTRHEYQYKEGTGAYKGWVQIANSGVDGANEAGFTVTGLTNEVLHTFQLRAVNAQGESTAAEADAVTPTPGICDRTQQVRDALLELTGVEDCKAVTVADLAGVTFLDISIQALGVSDITALKSGDFGGLTGLTRLNVVDQQGLTTLPSDIFSGLSKLTMLGLISNQLNSLPSNVFSDLTKLTALNLRQNELTSLPSNVFSDLTKLENLDLGENELTSPLPAGLFDGLTALEKLFLGHNELSSLPAGLFDDPTALETLRLNNNDLSSLPPNVFAGLAALEILTLSGNDLTSLPAGLFSGLTGLTTLTLGDNPNSGDTLALTVTVEKFGTDQARAKVLAGAPFAVDFTATVANGSLPTGVTKLAVEAGSVEGTAVTVTRTSGTMAAVTVDLDLSTQPTLATDHTGYEFEKAASGLPAEILPDTRGPQNFTAKPGDGQAVLSWTAPASGSGVTKHQYRQKEGAGSYGNWTDIPNSAEGGANEDGYTVTGLTNETVYTFELKRFVGTTESATAESNAVTPTPGICDRTQQVQDGILAGLADVSDCAAVTVADLESFTASLEFAGENIASLKSGDFAGLSNLDVLELSRNTFTTLPANVFSGLTSLTSLKVSNGELSSIDARAFSGLTALEVLKLDTNDLDSLPGTVFSGLTTLITLELNGNDLAALPGTVFNGLSALHTLHLQSNDLTALPAGLFSGLSALSTLTLADNDLTAIPAQVFSGLSSLEILNLSDNDLNSLDAGVFSGLSNLRSLSLRNNQLSALPDGLFSGLTALTGLNLSDNTTNPMPLTVTVEKFGTDQAQAKVLAGAPFAVEFTATVVDGSLPTGVTKLAVAKGSAEGTAVTVTRTTGTMEAVTVDIDLSTQPSLPDKHEGYTFARASDLPAEILPAEASLEPPTGLSAMPGDRQAVLTWTPPASDSGFTRHQYRYGTDGDFVDWTDIPDSGPGEANATRYTVTGLDNAVEYSFELRARDAGAGRSHAATVRVTPTGPPRILSVEVTSGPGLDNGTTYGAGEEVEISVTFDQPVEVSGDPELALDVGGPRLAEYHSGGGSETLVFVYVVTESDRDANGVSVGDDALRLNGGRIGNGRGDAAELTHDGLGEQSGHMVDGARRAGVHTHAGFTHSHSHSREQYPEHTHEGHEHPDDANGHKTRPGTHVHHAQEDLNAEISGGPDVRTHDWVEHIHRCFDLKPSCNQGALYSERGDELGLPIEVTHSHEHSEPGHRFDWRAWFEEGGSGATVSVADAVAVRGVGRTLDFEVSLDPAVAFAVRVDYATVDGTATAGEDYRETSGVLEIPPGQTRGTVSVRMPADGPGDGPELFELRLSSATAATVADGAAMGTILMPGPSTQPVIERIAVVSTPRLSWDGNKKDTYGEGENIRIAVTFDQPVLVVGDPTFALEVGDPCESVCEADYESGSGADTLVFAYLVLEVDVDRSGIAIRGNPIEVVLGDSIRNAAGQEALLSSKGKGTQRNHKVDGSQSAAAHLSVANAEAHEADGEMTFTVRLEPHGLGIVTVDYATRDGSARAGEDYTATGGTLRFNSLETERTVTVPITDDTVPDDGETFTLRLSNPDGAKLRDGDGEATGTIHNSEPQEALTASFEDVPAAHDGAAFRFRVAFSEDIGISFQALREDAFAVTNGRITDGVPVDDRRDLFDMTLEPDGDGDVAVTLEADRDCAESGAICTKGEPQRRLTTTVSAMVAGPDGAANAPATGAPAITGRLRVGEILSALTWGIADEDGLEEAEFAHQWLRGDADIAGATGYRYTLADSDEGKAIRVRVTFTDDAGNEETLTSAPTELVLEEPVFGDGPPGAPRNLTVSAGDQEVTLSWEPPADNGNAPATRYRIEWRIDGKDYKKGHWGPSGETTYTKTDLANGVKYIFRVKAENGNGNSYGPYGPASEEVSATPTSGLAVDLGTPVLSNTKTLHHGMVKLDWEDVEDAGWYVVQYYHVKGGEWLDLPAAGVDIAFHGSSAVVSNLHGLSWLRVRAMSCAGESEWSQIEELYGTNASDWEGVPVPEVAEGDEIEPCPVVLGTPVLSNTETLHHGMVRLDWEDIEDAGWHVVQYYHVKSGEWLDLPAEGVDIAFHGSSAVVSDLHGLSWLRVRAMSCAGASEWSQIEELYGTNASDWEGVPVPEVEEGDEIEPCPEDADTLTTHQPPEFPRSAGPPKSERP